MQILLALQDSVLGRLCLSMASCSPGTSIRDHFLKLEIGH